MPRFTHLIFDLDGTLVDTNADLAAATNYMRASFSLPPLTIEQVRSYIGEGARVLVQRALGATNDDLVTEGFAHFMKYYQAHLLDQTVVYAGIDALLTEMQTRGVYLSVLTNKPELPSRTILSGLGLLAHFRAVVGGDTLPVRKPHPLGVRHLQEVSGIPLSQTLLIGDSSIDIETGRAAGIMTCGVTWGFGTAGLIASTPQFLIDSPAQLQALIL
jgi:phosphoglycolate phosphatase